MRGVQRPEYRTYPVRFERAETPLTLCAQGAGAAMINARGIQDPERAIALGTPLLWIERMIGRATSVPSGCGVNAEPGKPWVKEERAHWGGP